MWFALLNRKQIPKTCSWKALCIFKFSTFSIASLWMKLATSSLKTTVFLKAWVKQNSSLFFSAKVATPRPGPNPISWPASSAGHSAWKIRKWTTGSLGVAPHPLGRPRRSNPVHLTLLTFLLNFSHLYRSIFWYLLLCRLHPSPGCSYCGKHFYSMNPFFCPCDHMTYQLSAFVKFHWNVHNLLIVKVQLTLF